MAKSTPPTKIFPQRLRAARKLRGFSQSELADRTGLQASAVSHFETGSRKPSFDNLKRLADALKITTDFLLGRVNDPAGLAGADRLHRHLEQLRGSDRDIAEKLIETLARRARSRNQREDR